MRSIAFWSICGIIFVIPWEEMAVIPGMETVAKTLGYFAIGSSFLAVAMESRIRRPPLAFLPLTLVVVWNFLSIVWSVNPDASMSRELTYLSLLTFTWMIWEFGDSEKRICWMFRAYLLGCCVALTTMFFSYVSGGGVGRSDELERFTGGDLNENDIATVLNIAIPFAAYLASRASRGTRIRTAYWAFIPVAAIGVLLTGSRMGVLVLGGGLLLTAVGVLARGLKLMIPLVIVIGVGLWLVPRFISEQLISRVAEGTESHTYQQRIQYWQAGWSYWTKHPLEGAGVGTYKDVVVLEGLPRAKVAHNSYVTILVEEGIVGAMLMLIFWFLLLRSIWKVPVRERLLWFTISGIWAVSSMAITWDGNKSTWLIYGAAMVFCALPKPNSVPILRAPVRRRQPGYC